MSLLVIAGAGASYDSDRALRPGAEDENPIQYRQARARPPLAAGLFDTQYGHDAYREAVDRYPRSVPAISRLRGAASGGVAIEEALGRLQDERSLYPELNAQLAAVRYYLRDSVKGVEAEWFECCNHFTNYMDLADGLARFHHRTKRRVHIATFNYDTLMERALRDVVNADLRTIDAYTARSDIQLFKPHGSVNWVRRMALPADAFTEVLALDFEVKQENAIIELSQVGQVQDEYETTARRGVIDDASGGTSVWTPALAIPTVAKQTYEAPTQHIDQLRAVLPEITDVLVIGWRGAERHFLKLLRDVLRVDCRLIVVSDTYEHADETVASLGRTGKFGTYARIAGGFSGLLDRGDDGTTNLDAALEGRVVWSAHIPTPTESSLEDV